MNNPNLIKLIAGFLLTGLVGCGYSPLDQESEAKDLAGTYLPGHSVVLTTKDAYSDSDRRRLHITLSADKTVESVLPDGWHSPMKSNGEGNVEQHTGTWSIVKNSAGNQALSMKLINSQTKDEKELSLSLAEHGDQPIIGLNVITEKTKWFGFSDTHIQQDIWFRKKSDKLDAYLEKNLPKETAEQTDS